MFELIYDPTSVFYIRDFGKITAKDAVCIWIHRQLLIKALIRTGVIEESNSHDAENLVYMLEDGVTEFLDYHTCINDDVIECWSVLLIGATETEADKLKEMGRNLKAKMEGGILSPEALKVSDLLGKGVQQQIASDLLDEGFQISSVSISTEDWRIRFIGTREDCVDMMKHCRKKYSYFIEEELFRMYKVFMEHQFKEFFTVSGVTEYMATHDIKSYIVNDSLKKLTKTDDIDDVDLLRKDF